MKAETLLKILEKIPGEYEVKFRSEHLQGKVEVDIINKKLILK